MQYYNTFWSFCETPRTKPSYFFLFFPVVGIYLSSDVCLVSSVSFSLRFSLKRNNVFTPSWKCGNKTMRKYINCLNIKFSLRAVHCTALSWLFLRIFMQNAKKSSWSLILFLPILFWTININYHYTPLLWSLSHLVVAPILGIIYHPDHPPLTKFNT